MSSKILVLNPNPDNLEKVFERANIQDAKIGPFAATILLGDVLTKDHHVPGTVLRTSTYFSQGTQEISKDVALECEKSSSSLADITETLVYAKPPFSVIKLVCGVTMLIISGTPLTQETIDKISNIQIKIDLLFTYHWPYSIAQLEKELMVGDELVDQLVKIIRPKYHFAVGSSEGLYFELQPFLWPSGEVTRFISLAQEGGKDKWYYAFNCVEEEEDKDLDIIENPFISRKKRTLDEMDNNSNKKRSVAKKTKVVDPEQCFFCLSNPSTETHMIVSIGTYTYLTIAKGPLTRSSKDLPFSGHGILIPIRHIPQISHEDQDIKLEIDRYANTLVSAFSKQKPFLRLIFFEVSRHNNVHHHIQFLPVNESIIGKFDKSLNFRVKLNNEKFKHNQKLQFKEFIYPRESKELSCIKESDFIKFTICSNNNNNDDDTDDYRKVYIAILEKDKPVDIHFPRRVLAHMLNLPDRIRWDKCQQSKVKEMNDCEEFKAFYRDYDFT
ncbi:hypothetical protein KGF56_003283 [Candida oxycetoniae]|uniref:CWF19-like protein DRN1 n=1 Tax=Candida oxycetoniae TaxID=497107 RepID=A0AAI9SVI1_9ASCO|nr:uncharacterized protein KGF56_003283 [Candida oxycetoniae]KAI3403853.2 hypothetical protein KGF56_003283 [Candida oxycetoniae]